MMSQPAPKIPRETERKTLAKILVLPVHPCQVGISWLITTEACASLDGIAQYALTQIAHGC